MNAELMLVDGYSVIHAWPELRTAKNRSLAAAREELVRRLVRFADGSGTAVAVVFDGRKSPPAESRRAAVRGVEVLFSKRNQTADEVIERCVAAAKDSAAILVVTEDGAERRMCEGLGARVADAEGFRSLLAATEAEIAAQLSSVRRKGRWARKLEIRC